MGLTAPTTETPDAVPTQRGFVTTTVDSLVNWDYALELYEKASARG